MLLIFSLPIVAENSSLRIVSYNVENLFDTQHDTLKNDSSFLPDGMHHWTYRRYQTKIDRIAQVLVNIGGWESVPLVGLCEVENRGVLSRLLYSTLMRKYDYGIVHFDSGDRRGIDVALLYRKSSFEILSTSLKTPVFQGEKLRTRDMLHVRMKRPAAGDTLDFIVCHHPSKYGGSDVSQSRRVAAMESLVQLCDSLGCGRKVVMGDFNDVPSAVQFDVVKEILSNKATSLFEGGLGTIRYKGKWELIDMFLVDSTLDSLSQMDVVQIPFLMIYDRSYPGYKPLRTYSGPKYLGGVSDHCPIILKILLPLKDFR